MSFDAPVAPLTLSSVGKPDFEALFRSLPSPYMILDRELRYVEANEAYCAVTERRREELIGYKLFDLFPNPGEGGRRLRASLEKVFETGKPDSIPLIPYPIKLPLTRGGGFEMRYWSAAHTPLLDADGHTRFVVQNTVDVTELQRLRAMAYGGGEAVAPAEAALLQRAQEVQSAKESLQEETRSLLMEALPEIAGQGFGELPSRVMRTGEPYVGAAVSVMLQRTPGPPEERFVDFIYQPMRRTDGTIWGVFVEGSDVTDRVMGERRQKLLLDELNHRVKNTLSTVQAIAAQSLRSNGDPAQARAAFESRLIALSATHDLLTATSWRGAALRDVLRVELQPYSPERYRLAGPDVDLTPSEALALGLLFHELATNAAKYGALHGERGRLDVSWGRRDDADGPRLTLDWIESGGPPVKPPTRRGFGSRLIERSLRGVLNGSAELSYPPEGLRCHIDLPLKREP